MEQVNTIILSEIAKTLNEQGKYENVRVATINDCGITEGLLATRDGMDYQVLSPRMVEYLGAFEPYMDQLTAQKYQELAKMITKFETSDNGYEMTEACQSIIGLLLKMQLAKATVKN